MVNFGYIIFWSQVHSWNLGIIFLLNLWVVSLFLGCQWFYLFCIPSLHDLSIWFQKVGVRSKPSESLCKWTCLYFFFLSYQTGFYRILNSKQFFFRLLKAWLQWLLGSSYSVVQSQSDCRSLLGYTILWFSLGIWPNSAIVFGFSNASENKWDFVIIFGTPELMRVLEFL